MDRYHETRLAATCVMKTPNNLAIDNVLMPCKLTK